MGSPGQGGRGGTSRRFPGALVRHPSVWGRLGVWGCAGQSNRVHASICRHWARSFKHISSLIRTTHKGPWWSLRLALEVGKLGLRETNHAWVAQPVSGWAGGKRVQGGALCHLAWLRGRDCRGQKGSPSPTAPLGWGGMKRGLWTTLGQLTGTAHPTLSPGPPRSSAWPPSARSPTHHQALPPAAPPPTPRTSAGSCSCGRPPSLPACSGLPSRPRTRTALAVPER